MRNEIVLFALWPVVEFSRHPFFTEEVARVVYGPDKLPAARDTLRGMGCSATLETAALAHSDDPEGLAQVIAKAQGELVENERCAVM